MKKTLLITGGAGFIGSSLAGYLLSQGHSVVIIDNFDAFYSRKIKENNIKALINEQNFKLIEASIEDFAQLEQKLAGFDFDAIIHLAARAGVRPSIQNPFLYQQTNVNGTQNLLELARAKQIKQFVFASSSSVYGINSNYPWSEEDHILKPISPYASTKISGELLGHVYAHLFGIRFVALRFFTVYGPRQRPDLAIHKFSKAILNDQPVTMFGDGSTRRDYTYIDDIVSGVAAAIDYDKTPYEIINLGNNVTVSLSEMIETLEKVYGKKALIERKEEQPGDVPATYANIEKAQRLLNYHPGTTFKNGILAFKDWFLSHQETVGK